jgi:hypothetical protein
MLQAEWIRLSLTDVEALRADLQERELTPPVADIIARLGDVKMITLTVSTMVSRWHSGFSQGSYNGWFPTGCGTASTWAMGGSRRSDVQNWSRRRKPSWMRREEERPTATEPTRVRTQEIQLRRPAKSSPRRDALLKTPYFGTLGAGSERLQ